MKLRLQNQTLLALTEITNTRIKEVLLLMEKKCEDESEAAENVEALYKWYQQTREVYLEPLHED